MIFDFSISIPVWRKSSPKQDNFDRFFGGFWQFLRRWYELDPNEPLHNDQWKILNKLSPIWASFEEIFFKRLPNSGRLLSQSEFAYQIAGDYSFFSLYQLEVHTIP